MSLPAQAGALALGAVGGQAIFGGFAPFPNSIMIPFMGAQSAVLGYQFGLNYEIGKRTIKAMDNDLFNRIVSGSNDKINIIRNGIETTIPINQYIPTLIKSQWEEQITSFRNMIPDAQSLMNDIIQQSVQIELKKAERTPSAWVEIIRAFNDAVSKEVSKESGIPAGTTLQDLLIHLFNQPGRGERTGTADTGPTTKQPEPPEQSDRTDFPPPPPPPEQPPAPPKEPEPPSSRNYIQTLRYTIQYTDRITGVRSVPQTLTETHNKDEWKKIIAYWDSLRQVGTKHIQYNYYNAFYGAISRAFANKYGEQWR